MSNFEFSPRLTPASLRSRIHAGINVALAIAAFAFVAAAVFGLIP